MQIKHTLAGLSLAAVVALAGCSAGNDQGTDPAAQPDQPAASDGGGQQPGADAAQPPEPDVEDVPEVVAEVNGEEIPRDEFVENYEAQFQQAAMSQQSTGQELDQDELKQQVAEQLVGNRLLIQAADDAGIEATDEDVDAFLEEIAAQNGMGSTDEFITALEQQGQSEEDIRADAATQHKLDTFIEQEADIQEPSDEELRQQYDQLTQQMEQQGGSGGEESQIPPFEEVRDQLADQAVTEQRNQAATEIAADLREGADVTVNL